MTWWKKVGEWAVTVVLNRLRCFAVILSRPIAWGLALLGRSEWVSWEYKLARRIDPSESCWFTRYLRRRETIVTHYPPFRLLSALPVDPVQYLEAFIQHVGICFEAFTLCSRLIDLSIREGKLHHAEDLLKRGYALGVSWIRTPANLRERSPFDRLIPNILANFIVGLWIVQRAREKDVEVQGLHPYEGWLVKLAQKADVEKRVLWGVWFPEAKRYVHALIHGNR